MHCNSLGVLTQALGYNFPLFLVYPVDMPETILEYELKMSAFSPSLFFRTLHRYLLFYKLNLYESFVRANITRICFADVYMTWFVRFIKQLYFCT